jgi:hypothetical protein
MNGAEEVLSATSFARPADNIQQSVIINTILIRLSEFRAISYYSNLCALTTLYYTLCNDINSVVTSFYISCRTFDRRIRVCA